MSAPPTATLPGIEAFCRTFELGSFTRAATALRVTPAAVSRAVARLERAVGVILFRRTTRALRPTAAAHAYHARCAEALALLSAAGRRLADTSDEVRGLVRLSVPTTYGIHHLLPRLGGLAARHPGIELEIQVSNHSAALIREGYDLAIRLGAIRDAGMVARRLGDHTLGVFASPRYLDRHGTPASVDDLARHRCIAFLMPRTGLPLPWLFGAPARQLVVPAALRILDDPLGVVAAARSGAGLCQSYHFLVEREVERGELVEVLAERGGRTRPFSLIYPRVPGGAAAHPRAVRAVIAFILEVATARAADPTAAGLTRRGPARRS